MTERVCPPTQDMVGIEKGHGSGKENTSCCCWDNGGFIRFKCSICQRAPTPKSPVISRIIVARQYQDHLILISEGRGRGTQ